MAWTTIVLVSTGELATAPVQNTQVLGNLNELRQGGISVPSQAALDFLFAETDVQIGRLAPVALRSPRLNAAGTAWEMVFAGAGLKELFLSASAFRPKPSGGCGSLEDILLSSGRYVSVLRFGASATQGAFLTPVGLPKSWNGGTVTATPYWLNTAGGAGDVVWSFAGVSVSDGDTLDVAVGTPQTSTDTAQAAEFLAIGPESSAITLAGTPASGDLNRFEVERTPTAGGDTYASDALLLMVKLRLTTDKADDA